MVMRQIEIDLTPPYDTKVHSITTLIFLPKTYNLNLILKQNQANPAEGLLKITG